MNQNTPYMQVRNAIAPCRTMKELSDAWRKSQGLMKLMDEGSVAHLVAMKDFYKGMIEKGDIDGYLKQREIAASKKWTGFEVQKPPHKDGKRLVRQQGRTSSVAVPSRRRKTRRR